MPTAQLELIGLISGQITNTRVRMCDRLDEEERSRDGDEGRVYVATGKRSNYRQERHLGSSAAGPNDCC